MGFWNSVGDLAKKAGSAALDEVQAAGARTKEYKAEMPSKSDTELVRIIKGSKNSPLRGGAASGELKARGYNSEDIKKMLRDI